MAIPGNREPRSRRGSQSLRLLLSLSFFVVVLAGAPGPALPAATETPAQTSVFLPAVMQVTAPIVYETTIVIPSEDYAAGFVATTVEDPVYPYPRLDFSRVGPRRPVTYRAIVVENEFVRLTILPELGGRIYGWTDRRTGAQLLYQNPIVRPTTWGYRGWWLSAGGIEWAFPVDEHGLNEWRPWHASYEIQGGQVVVSVWDVEDRTGMTVGATIILDNAHSYVTLQPWARNETAVGQAYQFWLSAMTTLGNNRVSPETRIVLPAEQVVIHSSGDSGVPHEGSLMSWPVYEGRDMSRYGNWNGWLGFFAPAVSSGFTGLYDPVADQGIVRAYTPGAPAGTKIFGPATLPAYLWTNDDSNFVELWSGATASFWNYETLPAGGSIGWTEYWYPVHGLGSLEHANRKAALHLAEQGGQVEVGVVASSALRGQLLLFAGRQQVAAWPLAVEAGQPFRATWARVGEGAVGVRVVDEGGGVVVETGATP